MNPLIHGQTGWLFSVSQPRFRDRVLVTLCALFPDLDGIGILVNEEMYVALHHKLLHGIIALCVIPTLGGFLARSFRVGLLCLLAYASHIVMDLAGSGPGWPIWFWYPFSNVEWLPTWQWDLASWQNTLLGLGVVLLCLFSAAPFGRTPVELVSRKADAHVVRAVRQRWAQLSGRRRR